MTDTSHSSLHQIVRDADTVFPAIRLTGLGVCNCPICMDDEAQRHMAERDRGEITADMLRAFYDAATGDSGRIPARVALHLTPRILRMIADGEEVFEIETYLDRLAYPQDDRCSEAQLALLDQFRTAYIDTFRGDARGIDPMLDDVFCMFAKGGFDLDPVLAQLDAWPAGDLIDRFWMDWCSWCRPSVWRTAFWSPTSDREAETLKAAEKLTALWYGRAGRSALDQIFDTAPDNARLWQRAADVEVALASFDER